jgi:hypothetical protein
VESYFVRGRRKRKRIARSIRVKKNQVKPNDSRNEEGKEVVKAEEAIQGSVVDREPSSDSVRDVFSDKGYCGHEARNHRRPSEAHLPSWKNVSDKCGSHH